MKATCPQCARSAEFADSLAGSEARCPDCGALISLPAAAPESAPEATADDSRGSVFARLDISSQDAVEAVEPPPAARPRPIWTRLVIVGLPLLVLAAAGGAFAYVRHERAAYLERVEGAYASADAAYSRGEMEKCEQQLCAARALAAARPETVPAERGTALSARAELLSGMMGRWREAREVLAGVSSDPAATRRRLEDLLTVALGLGADAAPVAELIRGMGRQAYEVERADRRRGLESHLTALTAQMDKGEFEPARDAIMQAREQLGKVGGEMGRELAREFEPRLEAMEKTVGLYDELAALAAGAPEGGPQRTAVGVKIAEKAAAPPAGATGVAGLAIQVARWREEMAQDRRPLPAAFNPMSLKLSLQDIARHFAAAAPGFESDPATSDEGRFIVGLKGPEGNCRVALVSIEGRPQFVIEIGGVRVAYPAVNNAEVLPALARYEMTHARALARWLREWNGDEAWSAAPWTALIAGPIDGPEPAAMLRGKNLLCTAGKVWPVEARDIEAELRRAADAFGGAARALEQAVLADTKTGKELREMLAMMVRAAHQQRKSADFLPRQFCSEAIARGYIQRNAPDLAERLRRERAAFRAAYAGMVRFLPRLLGRTPAGDEIEWCVNADGRRLWRIYDARSETTTFALRPEDEHNQGSFTVHTIFAGHQTSWPATEQPTAVRMVHAAAGEVASWDPATDRLVCDPERWAAAARMDELAAVPKHFGQAEWRFPPHVLLTDQQGAAVGLVVPAGRLDLPEFGNRTGEERRAAQDEFLERCAKLLRSPGELHLLYRYFVKYTYDSPLTDHPFLIGDRQNTGDVHQDAYQTLDRKIAGRFIADCDDLAELYQNITRRQGRFSFVLGQPSHAVCGFVERAGDDHVFVSVDTGPPRSFRAAKLEDALETGFATFDDDRAEAFDPYAICFLLRFAGEPTRTPYVLGARMFVDPRYAETMIRVQRDWHYAFIATGRDTMVEMVKHETDPPTLFELAGFYRELCDWSRAIEFSRKGIEAMSADDVMGRASEYGRLASYHERSGNRAAAVEVLRGAAKRLTEAEAAQGADGPERFAGIRFNLAGLLESLDEPWEAWNMAAPAVRAALKADGRVGGGNVTRLAEILLAMREAERAGTALDAAQKATVDEITGILTRQFASGFFKKDETLPAHLGKYADLAIFYAAQSGRAQALAKLLAPGPFPSGPSEHHRRRSGPAQEDEDWKWIRLSATAYARFSGHALNPLKPVAQRRPEEAVRIADALEKAVPEIRKQGTLGATEFAIVSMRLRRDIIARNWAGLDETFRTMKKQDWSRLYLIAAMSLGGSAPYVTPEEFQGAFERFCAVSPPLQHHFRAVYEALGAGCPEAALRAASVTARHFPDNPDVQHEFRLLRELLEKRDGVRLPADPPEPAGGEPGVAAPAAAATGKAA